MKKILIAVATILMLEGWGGVTAFAEIASPVSCHSNSDVREIVNKQVPNVLWVDLDPDQVKLLLSALAAKDPSFDPSSADAILVGKAPNKKDRAYRSF